MNRDDIIRVVRRFSASRARRNTVALWEKGRWMDAPAIQGAARAAAALLRDAGIENAHVEDLPADGKSAVNGWFMPIAWTVKEARLETAARGGNRLVLADYAANPQSIAMYSPSTPGGKWVEGEVLAAAELPDAARRVKGRFVLLETGRGSQEINERAARHGALALLTITDNPIAEASRYLNYSVPLYATRQCVPVFSLSPDTVRRLRAQLAVDPRLRLRARVRAKRHAGTLPLVTGSVGSGGPELFICGHIDEIGAQDNASGCGVAIEMLRVLQQLLRASRVAPQQRAIRFFFSSEVRGVQWWLAQQKRLPNFLGGINLDMVAAKPTPESGGKMRVLTGFAHRPHFADHLIREAAAVADREVGGMLSAEGHATVSDGVFGIYKPGGFVSLEQKTGPTYHSSADTPATLRARSLRWTGTAALAFLYRLSRLDNRESLRLASRIHKQALAAGRKRTPESAVALKRASLELASIRRVFVFPNMYPAMTKPSEFYRAGVSRVTGCWPDVARGLTLDGYVREVDALLARCPAPAAPRGAEARARRDADALVPVALERGFLNFETCTAKRERDELRHRTGLDVGWSTAAWAWMLVSSFTGKRTLAEIVDDLRQIGVRIDYAKAVNLTRYLVDAGRARLRPILQKKDILASLRAVGVRRGSILLVHSSLSAFGYVRGGPATLIAALREALGPRGTLFVPTHSNNVLGAPPYDPAQSRSNTGAVTEYFRRLPGVLRSAHPTHSDAGIGPAAADILGGVRPDQAPLARDGFWGRLADAGGSVLLLCRIGSATIFHVGETWVGLPQAPLVVHYLDGGRRRQVRVVPNAPWHTDHFEPTMARPLIRAGIMTEATLGESMIRLAPARAMAEISVKVTRQNPLISIGRGGTCTCHNCETLRRGVEVEGGFGAKK